RTSPRRTRVCHRIARSADGDERVREMRYAARPFTLRTHPPKEPTMVSMRTIILTAALLALGACTAPFTSTWKAPDAQPFELRGAKVAAVVMMRDEAARRSAEDTLANAISAHGAQGVPMYQIFPDAKPTSEADAKRALEKAGFAGAVVLRPVG